MADVTDGLEYEHHDPRKKAKTHYDEVWDALEGSTMKMYGDHGAAAGMFRLVDPNLEKVGEVTFDNKGKLLGAVVYGEAFVAGRIRNQRQTKFDLLSRLGELNVKRGYV